MKNTYSSRNHVILASHTHLGDDNYNVEDFALNGMD